MKNLTYEARLFLKMLKGEYRDIKCEGFELMAYNGQKLISVSQDEMEKPNTHVVGVLVLKPTNRQDVALSIFCIDGKLHFQNRTASKAHPFRVNQRMGMYGDHIRFNVNDLEILAEWVEEEVSARAKKVYDPAPETA